MIKSAFASCLFLVSTAAFAGSAPTSNPLVIPRQETVVCQGVDGEVRFEILVDIQNLVDSPQAITMRVSDPNVSNARTEIAVFESSQGVLNNDNGVVVGYIDERNRATFRKGERIGGTTLGQLRSIMVSLDIDFDLADVPGKKYSAQAIYLKRSAEQLVQDLDCVRQR